MYIVEIVYIFNNCVDSNKVYIFQMKDSKSNDMYFFQQVNMTVYFNVFLMFINQNLKFDLYSVLYI
jgi:hypothetical protein